MVRKRRDGEDGKGARAEDGEKEIDGTQGTCWREIRGGELYV